MATTEKTALSRTGQPLMPPDERFWKRYSPHYELPLAGATSFFIHGIAIGILAVGGLAFLFRGGAEATPPPQMDVLMAEAGAGFGGLGGDPGLPGLPGAPSKTEQGPQVADNSNERPDPSSDPVSELPTIPEIPLDLPSSDSLPDPAESSLQDALNKLKQEAEKYGKPLPSKPAVSAKAGPGTKAGGTPGGQNGQGGSGGDGKGKGPGKGPGGVGRKATDQEIKAWRWRFDLAGTPKEHADKLDRAGLIIAIPEPGAGRPDPEKGPYLLASDLKRRPIPLAKIDLAKYQDSVKWYNSKPDSVRGLIEELKLPFVPPFVVLLLPKDRETKMAAEERRFAQQNRLDPAKVQETTFDFRLQNGMYEPIAIKQK